MTDRALVVRIEKHRADVTRAYVEGHRAAFADHGAETIDVAGGIAAWASRFGSPATSRAFAVGLEDAVARDDLARIEDFYARRDAPARLTTTPVSHPSLFAALAARRWAITQWDSVLTRPIAGDVPPSSKDVVVERVDRARGESWARLVHRGMEQPEGDVETDRLRTIAEVWFASESMHGFVATRGGEPAGAAGLVARAGVAMFFATATLPGHRRRGVQGALIATRLAHARALGCELALVLTEPGSDSERNLERFGFRIRYQAATFTR